MCPCCERAERRFLGTRTGPRGSGVPVPCVHALRVKAGLEESAAIHGNALGTDGRLRGRFLQRRPGGELGADGMPLLKVGGSWRVRSCCARSGPQGCRPGWRGGIGEAPGACGGGPPRDAAGPAHLEMAEGSQPGAGQGKKAVPRNSAFTGELKKGLSRLWFEDKMLRTWPELLRLQSEVSPLRTEGTQSF